MFIFYWNWLDSFSHESYCDEQQKSKKQKLCKNASTIASFKCFLFTKFFWGLQVVGEARCMFLTRPYFFHYFSLIPIFLLPNAKLWLDETLMIILPGHDYHPQKFWAWSVRRKPRSISEVGGPLKQFVQFRWCCSIAIASNGCNAGEQTMITKRSRSSLDLPAESYFCAYIKINNMGATTTMLVIFNSKLCKVSFEICEIVLRNE
jgi:hypothetical protein